MKYIFSIHIVLTRKCVIVLLVLIRKCLQLLFYSKQHCLNEMINGLFKTCVYIQKTLLLNLEMHELFLQMCYINFVFDKEKRISSILLK